MFFQALIAHNERSSETVYLVAGDYHDARLGAKVAFPESTLVHVFPVDDDDVPLNMRGLTQDAIDGLQVLNKSIKKV